MLNAPSITSCGADMATMQGIEERHGPKLFTLDPPSTRVIACSQEDLEIHVRKRAGASGMCLQAVWRS